MQQQLEHILRVSRRNLYILEYLFFKAASFLIPIIIISLTSLSVYQIWTSAELDAMNRETESKSAFIQELQVLNNQIYPLTEQCKTQTYCSIEARKRLFDLESERHNVLIKMKQRHFSTVDFSLNTHQFYMKYPDADSEELARWVAQSREQKNQERIMQIAILHELVKMACYLVLFKFLKKYLFKI